MASSTLKFLLGLYPKTDKIEQKRNELLKEFDDLNQYAKSDELARYFTLDKFINSSEFQEKKNFYKDLTFPNSEEYKKEQEYLRLKKWHEIKFYYKFKGSSAYTKFLAVDGSKEIADFEQLKAFIESADFKRVESYMHDKKKWEKTSEYKRYQEWDALYNNPSFKNYSKFVKSKEYEGFKKLFNSQDIVAYEERKKYIESQEFLSAKAGKDFKQTDAYQKFKEFEQWRKTKAYKQYFALISSPLLGDYKKINNSDELAYFNELDTFVKSSQYKDKKKEVEAQRFEQTTEYQKLKEYKRLASSGTIKDYYKTKLSEALAEFRNLDNSKMITDYEALEKYINSEEFKSKKAYLLDLKKWEKTDEYKQLQEYLMLKKAPKLIWYMKLKDSPKFNELRAWNLVFEDDFNAGLDRSKWLTRYFWGEVLLHDSYALPGEKHFFTDGKNIEPNGSSVKIVTKNEKVTGKEWNMFFGFMPKEFDYTSGILCSGSSFRTKYGKVEAKIRFDAAQDVIHAFWLSGDVILPQIDVFKYHNNKLHLSSYWGNATEKDGVKVDTAAISASKFVGNYFIYSLEWSPEKIVWRINNLEVKTQTTNIPNDSMYVVLNSGVVGGQPGIPSRMEIDWIRCYQKN